MTSKRLMLAGLVLMLLTVVLGALGGHSMEKVLSPDRLDTWHTAVRYQAWHGLAILLLANALDRQPSSKFLKAAALLMPVGVLLFSGSLYVLCLSGITLLGAVTPLGGVAMIAAWCCWIVAIATQPH